MNMLNTTRVYLVSSNSKFVPKSFLTIALLHNKNLKEAKVLQKFLGERKSGNRNWYKNRDHGYHALKFESCRTVKQQDNSKWNNRRINVLNKIFMMHITDLMSTGSIAELAQGKDIQITRVKMSTDLTHLHILWTSTVECLEIEDTLDKCASLLRHKLSQLRIVGEIPNIRFIRDKTDENLRTISRLLKNINIEDHPNKNITSTFKLLENLPMTQDIFGLDRQIILNKIRSRLKKSTEAWENHKKNNCNVTV